MLKTNSPKGNLLYNQNNFANKRISCTPQITSNLTTPATSDPDLKSSTHSAHNNSRILELFDKSSVVDFTIDEILNELGNESEIHNGSILLFPPRDKQEASPSHPVAPFKSSSLFCHKEQRGEEICTTENLSDSSKEFKSVRLISPKERRLPKLFNDRASHTEKSNNNVPASCYHSSSETTAEQKINVLDNSKGNNANLPNPHLSVNNIYNFDAHPWPKNTILIAGNSVINETNEKRISANFESVKVRCFSGATIDDMYFIHSLRNKFDMLTNSASEYIDILMISETKLDDTFPHALYHLKDFSNPCRLDRNSHGGGILVYLRDNIPSNLVKLDQKLEKFEGFFIELELSKKNKWFPSYSYNPHKGNRKQHLSNISKGLDELNSKYDNILIIGDFKY